ncbi:MAG: hypothetical protein WDO13_19020 [Verrucomicrobiota bacterium]
MAIFAMLIGAVQLSRATKGTEISEAVIEAALKSATTPDGKIEARALPRSIGLYRSSHRNNIDTVDLNCAYLFDL